MYVNTFNCMYDNLIIVVMTLEIKRIKNLREDHDLFQKEVADILKITQQQYSLYEKGIRDIPIELLLKLADYYNVSLDYILNRTNNKNINKN